MSNINLEVECYAGYRGDESPRCFLLGKRTIQVIDELDRWLDPKYRYFKVLGDDGGIYILRHDAISNQWEMTLFDSGARPETKLSST